MSYCKVATGESLSAEEICQTVAESIEGQNLNHVLLIVPDYTRLLSNAGMVANVYYHLLTDRNVQVDLLLAVGSHASMTQEQVAVMYGDIPFERFITHNWRADCIKLGEVPASYIEKVSNGIWRQSISVEINRLVMDKKYDLIISIGQVVPHEIMGMSSHAKNLFVGVGGSEMIHASHMMGALCGMEKIIGRDHTPVRQVLDYSMENFLGDRPIIFAHTVCTASKGVIKTHGLFIGKERESYEQAICLAQEKNITFVKNAFQKCVVYLDPTEFKSTWVGNKAIYRTSLAMAEGGELIILAGGVRQFSEDKIMNGMIHKFGFVGKEKILKALQKPENSDLRENMGVPAHLIHSSANGHFKITYAVKDFFQKQIAEAAFHVADYDSLIKIYDPEKLSYGCNTVNDEEIFFIPNPTIGLWMREDSLNVPQ